MVATRLILSRQRVSKPPRSLQDANSARSPRCLPSRRRTAVANPTHLPASSPSQPTGSHYTCSGTDAAREKRKHARQASPTFARPARPALRRRVEASGLVAERVASSRRQHCSFDVCRRFFPEPPWIRLSSPCRPLGPHQPETGRRAPLPSKSAPLRHSQSGSLCVRRPPTLLRPIRTTPPVPCFSQAGQQAAYDIPPGAGLLRSPPPPPFALVVARLGVASKRDGRRSTSRPRARMDKWADCDAVRALETWTGANRRDKVAPSQQAPLRTAITRRFQGA